MSISTKYVNFRTGPDGALRRLLCVLTACLLLAPSLAVAQSAAGGAGKAHRITGTVVDQGGAPIIGANVIVDGTTIGVTTDVKGNFTLDVPAKGNLQVSYLGYESQRIPITMEMYYMVTLQEAATTLQDVVVVGYGVQRKESVVGAISQVKGDALVDSGVSNITNALAGKLSGVTTIQTSGQPGENDAEILIRGVSSFSNSNPLVLVDGVERDFSTIDPNEVANISVLKDASATAVFGAKGANGVIIVTTKSGQEGKPKMDFSFSTGFTMPINTPEHVNSYATMSLMNVALMNDQQFESLSSQQVLNEYRKPSSRLNSLRYPDVDWLKEMTDSFATTINANFNIQGGTRFVKYFASVGYAHEGSIFKGMRDGKVDSRYKYNRFNFRTNVDFNVTPSTTVSFKLGGNVGIKNKPVPQDGDDGMWKYIFGSSTAKFPMYYPSWVLEEVPDLNYPDASGIRLISEADQTTGNPYYQMMRGRFIQLTDSKLFSDIIINQKLDFITKGLSVQGKVSLSTYYKYSTLNTSYDRPSWYLDFGKIDSGENPWRRTGDDGYLYVPNPMYTTAENKLQDGYYLDLYYDLSLNYDRTFGRHNVTGLFLFNRQEQDKGSDFPYYNQALVARVTYDYAHKYLVEVNMGYTGSERFAPDNRFGFFPSGAVGWVVSEERFFEPLKPWFSKLKLRYSQGLVGSDYANNRWLYMSEYSKSGNYIIEDKGANLYVQWEQAMKRDLGIELGFMNDELTFSVDLFDEKRDKMLISVDNNTPMWVGNTSKELNKGKIKKHGIEFELAYRKRLGKDWTIFVGGNLSLNENRILYADDAPFALAHQRRIGTALGAQLSGAYLAGNGYFTSIDDIHSNFLPGTVGDVVVGDYKFLDFTADGVIDKDDLARMEGSLYPPIAYAFNGGFKWKGLDVNIMFQGYAKKWVNFDQMYEWEFYKGNYRTHLSSLDYWSPMNPKGNHSAVHYSLSSLVNMSWSGYNESATTGGYNAKLAGRSWRRADFLRLKEVSIGYTWRGPKIKQAMGVEALKVYATGNNLLTFTDLLEGDPESKYLVWGKYPQMMTIKLGLQVTF
ncbi:TonB-dependent receptor [uncultured Alistipes sp.]|jgi:tonB-linked outer membrane protein, susC/ragA family|uniref:SusC/RagA family TonB-linked outer membrane protein n=1 Tax=uncultured Alistipes sp. TaxID=538949 RepID=UPI0025CE2851|nr:TonB-dependent receptor [uncultured Alistipes sp.]